MGIRSLAAAIVLQAIEDLWSPVFRRESADFFAGEAFSWAAGMAGMSCVDQDALLGILRRNGMLCPELSLLPERQLIKRALLRGN
jgi:hypothetical protein